MLKELDDYDWGEAFGYAGEDGHCNYDRPEKCVNATCSDDPFSREDVSIIFDMDEGMNDESSWVICGMLHDGRYFYLEAGCDYTGWDCQAGGSAWTADTLRMLIDFGMTDQGRHRLKKVYDFVGMVPDPIDFGENNT